MPGTDRMERGATSPAFSAIFAAGLLCGVMDITAAFLLAWIPNRVHPNAPAARHRERSAGAGIVSAWLGHWRARPRLPFPDCVHGRRCILCREPEASRIARPSLARGRRIMPWLSMASCTGSSCRFPACTAARSLCPNQQRRSSSISSVSGCRSRSWCTVSRALGVAWRGHCVMFLRPHCPAAA